MDQLQSYLKISLAQLSEAGAKPENQDTVGARIPEGNALAMKGIAIAVADGVSSSASARQASQTAVAGFLSDYYATPDTWRTQQSANRILQGLNRYLWGQSQNSVLQEGSLTTFSAIILKGDKFFSFHVGDSRIYRLRDGNLEQLTRDHTQKIDRHTTYLSRALGADVLVDVDTHSDEIECGDIYMLSTDGVHDTLSPQELLDLLTQASDLDTTVQNIYQAALKLGSKDNISLQLCRIEKLGIPSKADSITVLSKLPFPPILEPGQKLDGLIIKKIVHESERSQVYLVHDDNDTPLIMKTPSINYDDDHAYIERFVMEAWIGSRINHRHIVRIVEPKRARSCLYYLTEYIPGPTLTQLIQERAPVDVSDTVELVEQFVSGIRAFHRKDTLHQDIKPDNIVLGKNGATIVDFGSCWVAGIQEISRTMHKDEILGTLSYSAPEYRYGGKTGPRSDQFSLAVLTYELLTGKLPYGEKYIEAKTIKHFHKLQYRSALQYNPLVPIWIDRTLEKALSIQPTGRYDALSEWLVDLKRPNPNWLAPRHQPLLERDPVFTWKLIAAIGWLGCIALVFFCNQ